jgi:hypothetical protein
MAEEDENQPLRPTGFGTKSKAENTAICVPSLENVWDGSRYSQNGKPILLVVDENDNRNECLYYLASHSN